MNNKNLIAFLVIGLIVLAGGGFLVLSSNKKPAPTQVEQKPVEETVQILSPKDIGLTFTAGLDKKRVIMAISNTSDILAIDYQLSYTSKGDIPRGALGHVDVKIKGNPIKQEMVLGTCSDVCHYDMEVSNIKLLIKVTKDNNKVYQIESTLSL